MDFDRPQHLHKNIEVKAINRAIKIAYLIPYAEIAENHLIIDAVFYESYTRWSGARTLIIPTDSQKFLYEEYQDWLAFYDPDFIYSYVDLDQQFIEQIDNLCSPIAFLRHKDRNNPDSTCWRDYLPDMQLYFKPVSSISAIHSPYAGYRRAFGGEQEPKMTVVTQFGDPKNRFLYDNFGAAFDLLTCTNPIPGLYDTLCLAPKGLDERINVGTQKVNSISDILFQISMRKAFPISRFAMAHSKSIHRVEPYSWSKAFNLIVGETCLDRIHFWNSRHFSPDYVDTQGALIINNAHVDNHEFIIQLGKYLNNLNFLGQHGTPKVEIRSFSYSYEELSSVREKLVKCTFNSVFLDKKKFDKPAIPSKADFESFYFREQDIKAYKVSENNNKIQAAEPEHFHYTPPRFINLNEGQWIVELKIDRHNNLSRFSNVIDSWLLPRRRNVVTAFSKNLGKITKTNHLALLPTTKDFPFGSERIRKDYTYDLYLPDDETVFNLLISQTRPYPVDDLRSQLSEETYEDIAVSDKGQNLRGVISMFTSLNEAAEILTNKYWRELFRERMISKADIVFTINELEGRLPNSKTVKEKLREKLKFGNIGQVGEYLRANLLDTLEFFLRRSVFFRLYQWRCSYCGNSNTLIFDRMRNMNNCEICSNEHFAGIDLDWKYKLNGFVYSSLIERSGLPVLWTLGHLHTLTHNSFYYLPEVDLFPKYKNRNERQEIDILCVLDGKLYAVEVKLSAIRFIEQEEEIEKFIKKINLIRPDVALLAFEQYCESDADVEMIRQKLKKAVDDMSAKIRKQIKIKTVIASNSLDFNDYPVNMGFYGKRFSDLLYKIERK